MFLFLYLYVLKVREMSVLCIGQITYYQHKSHLNCRIVCIILTHKIKMYFIDISSNEKIRELEILKKQAVENEDYDEAKRCKICIENLGNVSKELFNLEKKKKIAVEKRRL